MSGVWTHGLGGCSPLEPILSLFNKLINQLAIVFADKEKEREGNLGVN
jgi:hypothetical protein